MITVTFSPQELLALRNLIDSAVRAIGMQGAEAAVVLDRKLHAAAIEWEKQQREKSDENEPARPPAKSGNGELSERK